MVRGNWKMAIVPGCTAGCVGIVALFAALLALFLLIIKLLWAWTVPDILPGAVEQGLVVESLGWFAAFKLAIFVAVFGSLAGMRKSKS